MAETNNKGKDIVLNGVGTAYISSYVNGKQTYTKCGEMQDIKLSFNASSDKVYGGDSMQPIYIITKDTSCTVTVENAVFNLEFLQMTAGTEMENKGTLIFNVDPVKVTGTTYTVNGYTTIVPEDTIVIVSDDIHGRENAKSLDFKADSASLGENDFNITPAGVITFGGSLDGKYISVNGLYTDEESRKALFTTASIPGFVGIRHTSMPIDMGDGEKVIIHTIIHRARSTGKLDVDFKRQSAATPQLEFEVMYDTNRTDDHIIEMTQQIVKG